jgi:hypothetical protein
VAGSLAAAKLFFPEPIGSPVPSPAGDRSSSIASAWSAWQEACQVAADYLHVPPPSAAEHENIELACQRLEALESLRGQMGEKDSAAGQRWIAHLGAKEKPQALALQSLPASSGAGTRTPDTRIMIPLL